MQNFSSSLYCSRYEALLELAEWFAVGFGGFGSASGSFAWKFTSWIDTLWYWGKGAHWVVWALRVWREKMSIEWYLSGKHLVGSHFLSTVRVCYFSLPDGVWDLFLSF